MQDTTKRYISLLKHYKLIKNTRFFTLTRAGRINNKPPDQTIPEWLLKCTCPQPPCICHVKLRQNILCIIGSPNQAQTPMTPSPTHTIQLIEFTYCHDRFPEQATQLLYSSKRTTTKASEEAHVIKIEKTNMNSTKDLMNLIVDGSFSTFYGLMGE